MKRNLLLVSIFSTLAFLVSAAPGLAQVIFNYSSTGATLLREEGLTELVSNASLKVNAIGTNGGTVPAGAGISFVFSTSITNPLPLTFGGSGAVNVVCTNDGTTACPITVSVSQTNLPNDTITLSFTASTTFTTAGFIALQNIRVNASLLTPGAFVNVTVSGTTNSNVQFNTSTQPVGQVASVKSLIETLITPEASILTCNPPVNTVASFTIDVAEAFPSALRTLADEGVGATSGDTVLINITNIPNGVTVTPLAPVTCTMGQTGCILAFGTTPPAQTSTAAGMALTFTYTVTAESLSVAEDAQFQFDISTTLATLPVMQATPSIATVQIGPTSPSTNIPLFSGAAEPTAQNVIAFADCVTDILLPYVTNFTGAGTAPDSHYDTGITISNTTLDPFVVGSALQQAGTCTLTLFPSNGQPGLPYTTASIPSGGQLGLTQANVPTWAGVTGYIIGTCGFQNAHTFVSVYDNAGLGSPGIQQGYVGLIIPNPSILSRNPAGFGVGESLGQ